MMVLEKRLCSSAKISYTVSYNTVYRCIMIQRRWYIDAPKMCIVVSLESTGEYNLTIYRRCQTMLTKLLTLKCRAMHNSLISKLFRYVHPPIIVIISKLNCCQKWQKFTNPCLPVFSKKELCQFWHFQRLPNSATHFGINSDSRTMFSYCDIEWTESR